MVFSVLTFKIVIPLPLFLCLSAVATTVAADPEVRLPDKPAVPWPRPPTSVMNPFFGHRTGPSSRELTSNVQSGEVLIRLADHGSELAPDAPQIVGHSSRAFHGMSQHQSIDD
jgi:hypothetical protein